MAPAVTKVRPHHVEFPFAPLPALSTATLRALDREAKRINDRYLEEFLEKYAFCPYSREGRRKGEVHRYVHYCSAHDTEPLVELMRTVASDPSQVVAQVIFPLIDVSAEDFARFCHQLTDFAHKQIGSPDVLAVAPLHPELRYNQATPEALIPLFRRTPDPTIQWVRLDALEGIYAGRESDTVFVDVAAIDSYMASTSNKAPLYDTIAKANAAMAKRLSVKTVEDLLADIAADAKRSYQRILHDDAAEA